jgi:hypothetical protein
MILHLNEIPKTNPTPIFFLQTKNKQHKTRAKRTETNNSYKTEATNITKIPATTKTSAIYKTYIYM